VIFNRGFFLRQTRENEIVQVWWLMHARRHIFRRIFLSIVMIIGLTGIFIYGRDYLNRSRTHIYANIHELYDGRPRDFFLELHYQAEKDMAGGLNYYVDIHLKGNSNIDDQRVEIFSATVSPGAVMQLQSISVLFPLSDRPGSFFSVPIRIPFLYQIYLHDLGQSRKTTLLSLGESPGLLKLKDKFEFVEQDVWNAMWVHALDAKHLDNIDIKNMTVVIPPGGLNDRFMYHIMLQNDASIKLDHLPVPNIR
jgi:hypothetical protein